MTKQHDPWGGSRPSERPDNGDAARNRRQNEKERLEARVAEVRIQILHVPFPHVTGNVEADAERIYAWADDRARNIVSGEACK